MKKIQSAIIKILLLVVLSGCMKNEFTVQFSFPKDHVGNYIIDYYAWDSKKGSWMENVASVQGGKAMVKCVTNRPTLVYIRDASSSNSIAVYAERGDDILISGDNPDMNTWTVKGNKESELWSEWRNKNARLFADSRDKFTKEKEKAISDFVNANKDKSISAIVLLTEWNRNENPDVFLKLWNSIEDDAKDRLLLEMCGAADMLGTVFEVNSDGKLSRTKEKKLDLMTVRSRDNGIDTLKFRRQKASLLYFFLDKDSKREETIDSIKVLVKAYPDSTKRIIADVNLRPDSIVWINSLRSDTINGIIRAWMPQGLAEPNLMRLGVTRIPWFVVVGKNGEYAYSGSTLKDAVAAFCKEMDKKGNVKSPSKP